MLFIDNEEFHLRKAGKAEWVKRKIALNWPNFVPFVTSVSSLQTILWKWMEPFGQIQIPQHVLSHFLFWDGVGERSSSMIWSSCREISTFLLSAMVNRKRKFRMMFYCLIAVSNQIIYESHFTDLIYNVYMGLNLIMEATSVGTPGCYKNYFPVQTGNKGVYICE